MELRHTMNLLCIPDCVQISSSQEPPSQALELQLQVTIFSNLIHLQHTITVCNVLWLAFSKCASVILLLDFTFLYLPIMSFLLSSIYNLPFCSDNAKIKFHLPSLHFLTYTVNFIVWSIEFRARTIGFAICVYCKHVYLWNCLYNKHSMSAHWSIPETDNELMGKDNFQPLIWLWLEQK